MMEFDSLPDFEILATTENYCSVRTGDLLETLMFMQDRGRRLQETLEDDEYINGKRVEFNILSFSKIPLKIKGFKRW